MIDSAGFLIASYAVMAAGMSVAVGKLSPTIGPRFRHLLAGGAPLAAVLAARLGEHDSVTLHGMDLFAAGGLFVLGIAVSSMVGKAIPSVRSQDRLPTDR